MSDAHSRLNADNAHIHQRDALTQVKYTRNPIITRYQGWCVSSRESETSKCVS